MCAITDIHELIIKESHSQNNIPTVLIWKHDSAHSFTASIILPNME